MTHREQTEATIQQIDESHSTDQHEDEIGLLQHLALELADKLDKICANERRRWEQGAKALGIPVPEHIGLMSCKIANTRHEPWGATAYDPEIKEWS